MKQEFLTQAWNDSDGKGTLFFCQLCPVMAGAWLFLKRMEGNICEQA
jgi:hypothetical protein